jgi:hypothetical protein
LGPSFLIIVTAQLIALLYFPAAEFMNRVFTTSTGDATIVVMKPALKAAVKWQGRLSEKKKKKNFEVLEMIQMYPVWYKTNHMPAYQS